MKAPHLSNNFDAPEFDGRPVEWWRAYAHQHRQIPARPISHLERCELSTAVPNESLHANVARVARNNTQGHTSILTTAGHVIQFRDARPAMHGQTARQGKVRLSPKIDAEGMTLVVAHYQSQGHNFTADQIPFDKTWTNEAEKDRIRKLWAEVQQKQQHQAEPKAQPTGRKPQAARQPAYA